MLNDEIDQVLVLEKAGPHHVSLPGGNDSLHGAAQLVWRSFNRPELASSASAPTPIARLELAFGSALVA